MTNEEERLAVGITWNELATVYDDNRTPGSRPARTLPMETVADWAKERTDLFYVDDEGYFCRVVDVDKGELTS